MPNMAAARPSGGAVSVRTYTVTCVREAERPIVPLMKHGPILGGRELCLV